MARFDIAPDQVWGRVAVDQVTPEDRGLTLEPTIVAVAVVRSIHGQLVGQSQPSVILALKQHCVQHARWEVES